MIAPDRPILSPVLVGRAREMESLQTALHTVQQGQGQVVLVAGDAGVGKSRLVAEIRQRAVADHLIVLQGSCFERDLSFPYAPLIDALRAFLGPQPAAVVADLLGVLAPELVKLLPELGLLLPKLHPTPALDPEAEKRRLCEALLQFFARMTRAPRSAPLLLILEDLHWGDEASLDFLHLLARRIAGYPILLLATYRREEVSPGLRPWLAQLGRGRLAREVVLEPLTRTDVHTMLQAIFDVRRPLQTEFLASLYTLTEGNPFFIEELLKALVATGDLSYADDGGMHKPLPALHIPPTVQETVQRRCRQLSAAARHLLTVAAVAGRRFDFALLQQVAALEDQALVAVIKELVAAQLVVEETAEQFAFRHALTRQAVYAQLLGRERLALHRSVGKTIEGIYAGALDVCVEDLAYHFYEAGEWAKALVYAQRAGEKAQRLDAPSAAVEHFTRALAAAQHLEQASSLAQLHRARGLAYETLGTFEQARADHETGLAQARAAGDRRSEWQALLDLGKLWAARDYSQAGDYFQRALDLARTLADPPALARTLNRLGNWHLDVEQPVAALRCHQEALALFQGLHDRDGLAQTFDRLALTSLLAGDLVQGAAYFKAALAHWHDPDDPQALSFTVTTLPISSMVFFTDTLLPVAMSAAERIHWCERALRRARELGWRAGEAYPLVLSGHSLGAQGQYGEALERVQRAVEIAKEIGHRQWLCLALRELGMLLLDLLALPQARHYLEQALALASEIGSPFHAHMAMGYLIRVLILQDDLAKAETLLTAALPPELPMQTMAQRLIWHRRAEFALVQGDAGLALALADRLFAAVATPANRDLGAIPSLARLRGQALTALQRWNEAEATLQTARTTAHAQGTPRVLWRIHLALGMLYQAQARHPEAEQAFGAARSVIEAIAASVPDPSLRDNFVRQATALLPHSKPSSPLQAAKQIYGGLTRREREVAVLLAQGKSNRAIADALVLSERTVEGHISHILAKLGFTSRAQIAVWAVEKGLAHGERSPA